MWLLDVFQAKKLRKQCESLASENQRLSTVLKETDRLSLAEVQGLVVEGRRRLALLIERERTLDATIGEKTAQLVTLDDEALAQSFGLYAPRYNLVHAEAYKERLDQIRKQQKEMIKDGQAATCFKSWTVDGDKKAGTRMINDFLKLILRSFNNECEASIVDVKHSNVQAIEKRISASFDMLNKLGQRFSVGINPLFFQLKLAELHLCYEYQCKKQDEKEAIKRLREQQREEAKVAREIEEARLKLEKEQTHFQRALAKLQGDIAAAKTLEAREVLVTRQIEIEQQLAKIDRSMKEVDYRENNTRAGYVYVISNIGSFGEHVYKIGVTRRLDPLDRVDELGDASVPFDFDVHALIFSDNAPSLENALHKAFHHRRLNLVNQRREYFKVRLEEIHQVVRDHHTKAVEFTHNPEAAEFRQSMLLRQKLTAA